MFSQDVSTFHACTSRETSLGKGGPREPHLKVTQAACPWRHRPGHVPPEPTAGNVPAALTRSGLNRACSLLGPVYPRQLLRRHRRGLRGGGDSRPPPVHGPSQQLTPHAPRQPRVSARPAPRRLLTHREHPTQAHSLLTSFLSRILSPTRTP